MFDFIKTLIRLSWTSVLLILLVAAPLLQAAAVNVRIVGLSTANTAHDVTAIASQLNSILAATSGCSRSSSAATIFTGTTVLHLDADTKLFS